MAPRQARRRPLRRGTRNGKDERKAREEAAQQREVLIQRFERRSRVLVRSFLSARDRVGATRSGRGSFPSGAGGTGAKGLSTEIQLNISNA